MNMLVLVFTLLSGAMPSSESPTIVHKVPLDGPLTPAMCGKVAQQTGARFLHDLNMEGRYGLTFWSCGPWREST